MAKDHDASQPAGGKQNQARAANAVAPAAAAANPPAPAYDPMRAEHEAAHAVVIDDLGGLPVPRLNIKAGGAAVDEGGLGSVTARR